MKFIYKSLIFTFIVITVLSCGGNGVPNKEENKITVDETDSSFKELQGGKTELPGTNKPDEPDGGGLVHVPSLTVLSFTSKTEYEADSFSKEIGVPIYNETGIDYTVFYIRFSFGFTEEAKQNAVKKITLVPYFPRSLPPVVLKNADWAADDCIIMKWEGLQASNDLPNIYRLTIPGGENGVSNGRGSYLESDVTIMLEAVLLNKK
jgi:hypothetical protein